jgi:hypothetical protein
VEDRSIGVEVVDLYGGGVRDVGRWVGELWLF